MTKQVPLTNQLFFLSQIILCLAFFNLSYADPIKLSQTGKTELSGHMELLVDASGELTLAEVLKAGRAEKFKPLQGWLSRGYSTDTFWIRFSFQPEDISPEQLYLWLSPAYLNEATVYLQSEGNAQEASSYSQHPFGDRSPISLRQLRHPNFVLPIEINDSAIHHVYMRIQSTSTIMLKGWLYDQASFHEQSNFYLLFHGGFLCICFIILFTHIVLASQDRSSTYIYYAGYVLFMIVNHIGYSGLLTVFFPDHTHLLSDIFTGGGISLVLLFFNLFSMHLLQTRHKSPRIHRYLLCTAVLSLVCALSSPFSWYGQVASIQFINSQFFLIILAWLTVVRFRKGDLEGKMFLIAFIPHLVALLFAFASFVAVVQPSWFIQYVSPIGTVIHMVLLTLALVQRVLLAEKNAHINTQNAEKRAVVLASEMTRELNDKKRTLETALLSEREVLDNQTRFVDIIAHEYRTPLATIRTNIDILGLHENEYRHILQTPLRKMERAVIRMIEIFDIALRQRKDEKRASLLEVAEVDFINILQQTIEDARDLIYGRSILLEEVPKNQLLISGDTDLLKTALLNLLENADKYSSDGSPIKLNLTSNCEELTLSITNNGRAQFHSHPEELFKKNYRRTEDQQLPGTGVGLYLVRKIIEQHGGWISISFLPMSMVEATICLPQKHICAGGHE